MILTRSKKRIIEENLFGAPNEYRARRIYGYLINRVSAVEKELADLFFSSDLATQKLINLIVSLKMIPSLMLSSESG